MSRHRAPAMLLVVVSACTGPPDDTGAAPSFDYPLDDVLRFHHVQSLGTHNSYHLRTEGIGRPEWDYAHAPLDVQLAAQGVRQFELDVYWNEDEERFDVYHLPVIDAASTCPTLVACIGVIAAWSDAHPAHVPLELMIEPKDGFHADTAAARLAALDAEIASAWPAARLITPDRVQGDAPTLRDAVAERGFPTLGELRGGLLVVLHADVDWRRAYTDGDTTTAGRLLFPDAYGDTTLAVGAVSTLNDPIGQAEAISAALAANHLVRTTADSGSEVAEANDTSFRDAGLAGGATFVTTDHPVAVDGLVYAVQIPGGTPSRCNPVTAPPECTPEAIEDPAFIQE